MAKRSATAERHADLIRTALFEVAPAGMTLTRLRGSCGLSRWQTTRGLATLRDLCAERGWPPVIWTRDLGCHFCASEAVRRPPDAKGFVVLPRRWMIERSWSWIMRARQYCRDHERLPEMSESLITWAAITLMTRRLTRRTTRPAERRDISPYYLAQAA
ncbi:hypothetical protein [Streptomyces avermitilis]|uniref:hypothetical protein n=1 Tax=Streptomyces avermitilis TaxID=33903 RepID=UPI003F53F502